MLQAQRPGPKFAAHVRAQHDLEGGVEARAVARAIVDDRLARAGSQSRVVVPVGPGAAAGGELGRQAALLARLVVDDVEAGLARAEALKPIYVAGEHEREHGKFMSTTPAERLESRKQSFPYYDTSTRPGRWKGLKECEKEFDGCIKTLSEKKNFFCLKLVRCGSLPGADNCA